MRKTLIAGLALALAGASPAFAMGHHHKWGGDGFSAATLQGTYIFEANGFADDGKSAWAGVLGTLTFDGTSAVTGDLTLTEADGAQVSCDDTFSTGGSYTVNTGNSAPGTGTLILPLTGGSINFNLLIPSISGKGVLALESDSKPLLSVTICGTTINSMVLRGHLKQVDGDEDIH